MPRIVVSYARPEKVRKYKEALKGIGGPAVEVVDAWSLEPPEAGWSELIEDADGLLLTGGSDVEPWRYGEAEHPEAEVKPDQRRDEMEWSLLDGARQRGLPVFGICRGHQVINAFLGGTLWQDLGETAVAPSDRHPDSGEERTALVHGLEIRRPGHPLGRLLAESGDLRVNSLHHQAVRDPAPGVAIVAEGPAGVVEALAVEDPDWWVWSVQWHPEELVEPGDAPVHRALFERFLDAARTAAERRRPAVTGSAR